MGVQSPPGPQYIYIIMKKKIEIEKISSRQLSAGFLILMVVILAIYDVPDYGWLIFLAFIVYED